MAFAGGPQLPFLTVGTRRISDVEDEIMLSTFLSPTPRLLGGEQKRKKQGNTVAKLSYSGTRVTWKTQPGRQTLSFQATYCASAFTYSPNCHTRAAAA